MKMLHPREVGFLAAISLLARRVPVARLVLGAGLVCAQPCTGSAGGFNSTGDLGIARFDHAATLLPDGKVLVEGGATCPTCGVLKMGDMPRGVIASAELYDPASGTWSASGSMTDARHLHTATLLSSGKVLVAGGQSESFSGDASFLGSAELYDPANGTWAVTGSLVIPRVGHTATLLPNGNVLVTGGFGSSDTGTSAELYDPVSGTWVLTGSFSLYRSGHTATLLSTGKVLVVGGEAGAYLASAELYDPASGTWTATGSLATARSGHTATLLPNGQVLVAGGFYDTSGSPVSAELYDPASGIWRATGSLVTARFLHTATLLPNGQVFVAGGTGSSETSAELYDPATEVWTETGGLVTNRLEHTATLLPSGQLLVAGGLANNDAVLASSELYGEQPLPPTLLLLNISTRMRVLTGDKVLIGGFIITGTDPKTVLVRGIGPSLTGSDVLGALSDPTLELHHNSATVATNDNWKMRPDGGSQQAEIEATTIPPTNDLESAILATLSPGAYTAILAGKNGGTGVGLVEVYDLGRDANSKLTNIGTRGFVDAGDNVMIGGFVVGGGTGSGTARVIVRVLGPSVPVAGTLGDPTVELHDGSGTTIATNDNWKTRPDGSSQEAEIEETTIPPTNDLESALVRTLSPGNYSVVVRGMNNATGVGLVEVYNLQ